jgi:hypothetical protein
MPMLGIMASGISGNLTDFTWTARTLSVAGGWAAAASDGGSGFVATTDGNTTNATYSTDNGVTWTTSTLPSTGVWYGLAWNGSVYACVRYNSSAVATSPTGATWTSRTGHSSVWYEKCTQWNGSVFCSLPYGGDSTQTSSNGTTWTLNSNVLPGSNENWASLAAKGSLFYGKVGNSTIAGTTTDGATWTTRTAPSSPTGALSANSSIYLLMVDTSSDAYTSTDGISWTLRTMPAVSRWFAVSYNGTNWVAARYNSGGSSSACTSPDAITWTVRTLPQSSWYAMASSSTITAVFPNSGTGAYTSPSK